jgi:hypothetical protein
MDACKFWKTLLLVLDGNNKCDLIKPTLVTNLWSRRTLGVKQSGYMMCTGLVREVSCAFHIRINNCLIVSPSECE